jgi:TRAP-type mannitol/chloroaromatic compound transport system permease small subunit
MQNAIKTSNIKKIGNSVSRLLNFVSYVFAIISGALILIMALVDSFGVTMRYVFSEPNAYAYLIVEITMLGCVFFAIARVEKLNRHVTVSFIADHLSKKVQLIFQNIIGPILGLIFCVTIIWMSLNDAIFALENGQSSMGLISIQTFPIKMIVPICLSLVSLLLIAKILIYLFSFKGKKVQTE